MTDLTPEQLDEIEKGCEGVTPFDWQRAADWLNGALTDADRWRLADEIEEQASHLARLDPDTIRALVRMARRAERLEAAIREHRDYSYGGGIVDRALWSALGD